MRVTPKRSSNAMSRAGYTFVEAAFTVGLLAVIIQVLVSTSLAMMSSGEFGHEQLQLIAAADDTLDRLSSELQFTSAGTDPVTNDSTTDSVEVVVAESGDVSERARSGEASTGGPHGSDLRQLLAAG